MAQVYYSSTVSYPSDYFASLPKYKLMDIARVMRIKYTYTMNKQRLVSAIVQQHEAHLADRALVSLQSHAPKQKVLHLKGVVKLVKDFLFYETVEEFHDHWRSIVYERIMAHIHAYKWELEYTRDLRVLYDRTLSVVRLLFLIQKQCSELICKPCIMYHAWYVYNRTYKPMFIRYIRYNVLFFDTTNTQRLLEENERFAREMGVLLVRPKIKNERTIILNILDCVYGNTGHMHKESLIKNTNKRLYNKFSFVF